MGCLFFNDFPMLLYCYLLTSVVDGLGELAGEKCLDEL